MKDLLKYLNFLPQILGVLPGIMSNLKSLVILVVVVSLIGGIGYGIYYYMNFLYKDPYKCYNNEIYERMSIDSSVYKFKGGYCI